MKKILFISLIILLAAGCSPSPAAVQTAIAETQDFSSTATSTPISDEERIQTVLAQTQAPTLTAAVFETAVEERIGTSVVQTLTAIAPTQTPTLAETLTPTATMTLTPRPWPTITNTPEPIIPSGAIKLVSLENLDGKKVKVNWEAEGSFVDGFHVLYSKINAEPTYPNDYWFYFADGKSRSAVIEVNQPDVYSFRVCEYIHRTGQCQNYSNTVVFAVQ